MNLSRRRMLKLGGAALGAAALGPKVTATPSGDRFTLDVGERVTDRDVVAAQRAGLEVVRTIDPIGYVSVRGTAADVRALNYDWVMEPELEFSEPEFNSAAPTIDDVDVDDVDPETVPFDAPEPDVGHFTPPALYLLQWDKISQFLSDALLSGDGSGRRVAIIDSGVYAGHPDLDVNTTLSMNLTTDSEDAGPWGGDHGTHVAGIATANGSTNTVGTAPGAEAVSYRVFSNLGGSATTFDIAFAIVDAALIGCDAANMSIGFPSLYPPTSRGGMGSGELIQSIYSDAATFAREQGTVVVNSAGNAETNLDQPGIAPISEAQDIVTVSATGPIGYLWGDPGLAEPFSSPAFYTNYGDAAIDIAAHGGDADLGAIGTGVDWFNDLVLNTVVDIDYAGRTLATNWGWKAGTSMAAPQVTGAIALIRDAHPEWTPQDVFDAMAFTTETASADGFQKLTHGNGQLRPDRAVTADLSEVRTGSGRSPESGRGPRSGRGRGRGGTYCNGETQGSTETECTGSSGAGGGRSSGSGSGSGSGRGRGSGRGSGH